MANILEDLVNGHQYKEDDRGADMSRVFYVGDLPSNNGITLTALYAVDNGKVLPQAGQTHPRSGEFVMRDVDMIPFPPGSKSSLKLTFRYVKIRRRLLDVRINGVSSMRESFVDKDGKRMRVGYKAPSADNAGKLTSYRGPFPDPTNDSQSQGWFYSNSSAEKLLPEMTLDIIYMEQGSPLQNYMKYGRRLNSKKWQGGEPREWLCENISGYIDSPIPLNQGKIGNPSIVTGKALFNWVVTYSFRHRPRPKRVGSLASEGEGFDPVQVYSDDLTGLIPTDIDPLAEGWPDKIRGNGWAEFQVYGEADFDELNLVSAVEVGDDPSGR